MLFSLRTKLSAEIIYSGRYPEIKDATERALATLKTIRELYISDIRKNTEMNPSLSQSNDISAPYILLCNYADATPKLVSDTFYATDKPFLCVYYS